MSTASSSVSPSSADNVGHRPAISQEQRTAEAKAAFVASLSAVGANLDTDLQVRAKDIHANSKALEKQEKELVRETKKLQKQGDAMDKVLQQTKKDLKGFEGLEGLMSDLDRDLAMLEETLRIVEGGDEGVEEEESGVGHEQHPSDRIQGDGHE